MERQNPEIFQLILKINIHKIILMKIINLSINKLVASYYLGYITFQ